MRVLVCGGRDWADRKSLYNRLDRLSPKPTVLVAGGANGADSMAVDWARFRNVPAALFLANWEKHGRAAGPIRNQQMLDEGKPDLVVAFPGGRGTADMVRRAKAAGVRVMEVE